METHLYHGDCLEDLSAMETDSVDLVFGSPPYEAARTYDIGFSLRGQQWVDWMHERIREMVRVSRGLVVMVIEGQTRQYQYSATPLLLAADLHRAGITLRKPPIYHRVGIPGSGGRDWLRNDYEFCLTCTKHHGRLPWSDNTAIGHAPKYDVGGKMSNRTKDGRRKNAQLRDGRYKLPTKANPGNVIHCKAGGGHLGWKGAHENEAPFPERLAEFFVRSFCPPGGTVLDPFCGSGTTIAVARKFGRNAIGIDIRESQIALTRRRLKELRQEALNADSG